MRGVEPHHIAEQRIALLVLGGRTDRLVGELAIGVQEGRVVHERLRAALLVEQGSAGHHRVAAVPADLFGQSDVQRRYKVHSQHLRAGRAGRRQRRLILEQNHRQGRGAEQNLTEQTPAVPKSRPAADGNRRALVVGAGVLDAEVQILLEPVLGEVLHARGQKLPAQIPTGLTPLLAGGADLGVLRTLGNPLHVLRLGELRDHVTALNHRERANIRLPREDVAKATRLRGGQFAGGVNGGHVRKRGLTEKTHQPISKDRRRPTARRKTGRCISAGTCACRKESHNSPHTSPYAVAACSAFSCAAT